MRAGQWLDDRLPSPAWSQPVRPFRLPRWVWALGALLILAALLTGTFFAGGFDERSDHIVLRRPDAVLDLGPYEIVLSHVEAQRVQSYDEEWHWDYRLIGKIRNTSTESVYFKTGEWGWIAFREPRSGEIASVENFRIPGDAVTLVPPTGEFMAAEWWQEMENEPSAYLGVGFLHLEYTDNSLLGFGERVWNPSDKGYQVYVPVIRLPDAGY